MIVIFDNFFIDLVSNWIKEIQHLLYFENHFNGKFPKLI